jgi:hypothetical protein
MSAVATKKREAGGGLPMERGDRKISAFTTTAGIEMAQQDDGPTQAQRDEMEAWNKFKERGHSLKRDLVALLKNFPVNDGADAVLVWNAVMGVALTVTLQTHSRDRFAGMWNFALESALDDDYWMAERLPS